MNKTFSFVFAIFLAVGLPMMLIYGAHQAAVQTATAPAAPVIPAVIDSGERWYNPLSWSLDEAAALATQQAQYAATATTSVIGSWTSNMFLMTGLLTAVAIGIWSGVSERKELNQAWKEYRTKFEKTSGPKTAPQVPPPAGEAKEAAKNEATNEATNESIVDNESEESDDQDSAIAGKPAGKHPKAKAKA